MSVPPPIPRNTNPQPAEHRQPPNLVAPWLPSSKKRPRWQRWLFWAFGVPLLALVNIKILVMLFSSSREPARTEAHENAPQPARFQPESIIGPATWVEPLASYLKAGPKSRAPECAKETNHLSCNPRVAGLDDASVGFLPGHPGAWSVLISPALGGDLKPGRFGEMQKLCDRPGLRGFGSALYRVQGGPLAGNFAMIQRTAEKPDGVQAIIKSPSYFRYAPERFNTAEWADCARAAGIQLP